MRIVVESHVPYIRGIFEPFAEVIYADADGITPELMKDADALITRTRTKVDKNLLGDSRCKVVATATIGTDHINLDWCAANNIRVVNAPGCNAPGVAQYVFAAISAMKDVSDPTQLAIGIIGVGNVGKIVEKWAKNLGMKVLPYDPPRAEAEGCGNFCSLDRICHEADIITFHTPMTYGGAHPTFHLCSGEFLDSLSKSPVIINAARGPVADNKAVLKALRSRKISGAAIDCWENEPDISPELLEAVNIATPHIAGYTAAGKTRASAVAVKAVADTLGIPAGFPLPIPGDAPERVTFEEVTATYNPLADTEALRNSPGSFEKLRNTYKLRKEVGE